MLALAFVQACTCGMTECKPGENTCPCKEASVCNDGLICTDNKCSAGHDGLVHGERREGREVASLC